MLEDTFGPLSELQKQQEQQLLDVLADALKEGHPTMQVSIIPPSDAVLDAMKQGHVVIMEEMNRALAGKWPPIRLTTMAHSPSALKALDFTSAVAMIMLVYAPDFGTLADRLPTLESINKGVWEHAGRRYVWDKKSNSLCSASIY